MKFHFLKRTSLLLLVLLSFPLCTWAQTFSITFNVNMSYQIEQGKFNPTSEFVDVAGTFNNWGGTLNQLSDTNGDSIYTLTLGGFAIGTSIEFKFRINGQWLGREEFPGAGNNRSYTVRTGDNIINVWYNDEEPRVGPPVANFSASHTVVFTNGLVSFREESSGQVSSYEWSFPGGTPSTSTEAHPVVRYPHAGSYSVTLVAIHEEERNELVRENYIQVVERASEAPKWWNETVFYEIFVRSFYDSNGDGIGDFKGLTQKLDYLNDGDPATETDLGITGIWLMPIHPSPSYHGYDVTNYRAIHPDFGTMDDFKEFLTEAHKRGIRVIIDYVVNHSSDQHPWFQQSAAGNSFYRDFYRWSPTRPSYTGPWGQQVWHSRNSSYFYGVFWSGMPDINYNNAAVKDSIFAAADFWIKDIGVDGFRLDAVKYIFEEGSILEDVPATHEFWGEFSARVKAGNPDAFTVGEAWTTTDKVLPYIQNDRLDYCFEFDLAEAMHGAVNAGNARNLASKMQEIYDQYPYLQYGTFLTNHDQNRVMSTLGNSVPKMRAAAAIYLTLPGIPYLYYGEEIGMLGVKPDPDIRRPMQWTSGAHAGFSTVTPWRAPHSNFSTVNVAAQTGNENSLLSWYRKLIHLRNRTSTLHTGAYYGVVPSADAVYAFVRKDPTKTLLVVINTSGIAQQNVTLHIPDVFPQSGRYTFLNLLNEQESVQLSLNEQLQFTGLSLSAYQVMVLDVVSVTSALLEESQQPRTFALEQNYPNPFNPSTIIPFQLPVSAEVRLEVYDILGRRVSVLADGLLREGQHEVTFDAGNLASGVYLYRLETNETTLTRKMMLVK